MYGVGRPFSRYSFTSERNCRTFSRVTSYFAPLRMISYIALSGPSNEIVTLDAPSSTSMRAWLSRRMVALVFTCKRTPLERPYRRSSGSFRCRSGSPRKNRLISRANFEASSTIFR